MLAEGRVRQHYGEAALELCGVWRQEREEEAEEKKGRKSETPKRGPCQLQPVSTSTSLPAASVHANGFCPDEVATAPPRCSWATPVGLVVVAMVSSASLTPKMWASSSFISCCRPAAPACMHDVHLRFRHEQGGHCVKARGSKQQRHTIAKALEIRSSSPKRSDK